MSVYRPGTNKSSILNYPTIRPTLDLDFANSKTLDSRITFTRSSGGSYVGPDGLIKYAGVNEARFDHDPTTGESLGLLIEESRTNLITYSEDFSNAVWNSSNITIIPNTSSTISPDGNYNAEAITHNSQSSAIFSSFSFSSGSTVTVSVFVKKNTSDFFRFEVNNSPNIWFNLNTGKVASISVGSGNLVYSSSSITTYPNGWYRCSATYTTTTITSSIFSLYFTNSDGNRSSVNSSGSLWGAQVEQGAFPTSYIPTVAATRTRTADSASITGRNFSSFYRQDEGTLFASARVNALGGPGFPGIAYVDDGTLNNAMGFYVSDAGDDKIGAEGYVSSVPQYPFVSISAASPAQLFKVISTYKVNDFSAAFSMGGTVGTDTSGSVPTVNRLLIGSLRGDVFKLNGPVSRITYYPKKLPNAQLQALTR